MRNFHKAISAALVAMATVFGVTAQNTSITTRYKFADTNPLATGHWVKISIEGSGVYEISYDRLREMGFENPEQVAVYGTGGQKREVNFTTSTNKRVLEDVIAPIPVTHRNGKLIFYGLGDRVLKFQTHSKETHVNAPCVVRESLNPYSEKSYYMLTDSHPVVATGQSSVSEKEKAVENTPYGHVYHEQELTNGRWNQGGEVWFGEDVAAVRTVEFPVEAKYCNADNRIYTYADIAVIRDWSGLFKIGLNGAETSFSLGELNVNVLQNWYNDNAEASLNVDANHIGRGTLSFAVTGNTYPEWDLLAVDYWTLIYPSSFNYIDEDPDFSQFTAGFLAANGNNWKHHLPQGTVVWDITNPLNPCRLDSDGEYFYSSASSPSSVVAFNPDKTLKQIDPEFKVVANQDLHALQKTAYDMVIITVPDMKKYADRIAEVHARTDGQKVAVVLAEETYNEFNAGTPDAMCYRMLAKMLYHHTSRSLKNILLLGPVHSDFRNLRNVPNRIEGMIAFQANNLDLSALSYPDMDFYGIMTDYMRSPNRMEIAPITLGVGVLPITNDAEGELTVDKIRAHLEKQDFSGMVNETYSIGYPGDAHIHEKQAIKMGNLIQSIVGERLNSEFAHETLWLDGMTSAQGRDHVMSAMRRGKSFLVYFGHATRSGFSAMTVHDAMNAGNNEQGVGFFAGCDLTAPDIGEHGMGDMPVIHSRSGFIGIVSATRSVLSNQNEVAARNFTNAMFYDNKDNFRTSTPTIGEVYAGSKDRTTNNSSLAYIYVGDPSLRVPVALTKVRMNIPERSFSAGEIVEVTGEVLDYKTENKLSDYNGFVTLKLMEPARTVPEITNQDGSVGMPQFEINDLPIIAFNGTVKNGEFNVKVRLPEEVNAFASEPDATPTKLKLLAGTYDNTTTLSGSGRIEVPMASYAAEPDPESVTDTRAPTVSMNYNEDLGVIGVSATDDVALCPGIGPGTGISLIVNTVPATTPIEMSLAGDKVSEGVNVPNFSGSVDISRLAKGVYSARAYATDLAGNVSSPRELFFTVSETSELELAATGNAAIKEMTFTLAGGTDREYTLLLMDRGGNIVSETTVSGRTFGVETADLEPGTYRAYVQHNSPAGTRLHSNQVEFTVIK